MASGWDAAAYLKRAEEAAAHVAGIDEATPRRPVETVGVIGAGTLGAGIAMVFANAGLSVTLVERDEAALSKGLARIREIYERARAKGTLTEAELMARQDRIVGATDLSALGQTDLII